MDLQELKLRKENNILWLSCGRKGHTKLNGFMLEIERPLGHPRRPHQMLDLTF